MPDRPAWLEVMAPAAAVRHRVLAGVVERLQLYLDHRAGMPVVQPVDAAALRAALAAEDFSEPRPLTDLVAAVAVALEHGMVHTGHPRYFGLFNPPSGFPGQIADIITAVVNPQLAVWSHAAVPVEIERRVVGEMGNLLGLPCSVAGHFTTGGSEANFTALLLALTRTEPRFAAEGVRGYAGQPVLYASSESHLAWIKIAHQAGLGREAVRLVSTDEAGRLDPGHLEQAIAADRAAGHIPVMIVATAGTTTAGVIDPLPGIADVAGTERLHYHVDAAWGGAAAFSPTLRAYLEGIERADTVTVDAHKWLAVPMGAGMLLCRDGGWLHEAFHVATGYMPPGSAADDPYTHSVQWSRRFAGLKLYLSLASLGCSGYGEMIDHMTRLGEVMRCRLRERGWTVRNPTPLPVVCFTGGRGDDPGIVAARVQANGGAWISAAKYVGRPVLRACITSFETTEDDVARLADVLDEARR